MKISVAQISRNDAKFYRGVNGGKETCLTRRHYFTAESNSDRKIPGLLLDKTIDWMTEPNSFSDAVRTEAGIKNARCRQCSPDGFHNQQCQRDNFYKQAAPMELISNV